MINHLIDSEHQPRIVLHPDAALEWLNDLASLYDQNGGEIGLHNAFDLNTGPHSNSFEITSDWAPQDIQASDALSTTHTDRHRYGVATGNVEFLILAATELGFLESLPGVELNFEEAGPGCYQWVVTGQRYCWLRLVSPLCELRKIGASDTVGPEQALMILLEAVDAGNAVLRDFMIACDVAFAAHSTDPVILRRLTQVGEPLVQEHARLNPFLAG